MKVPLGWLREYVAFDATPAALAEALTMAGIQVEGIESSGHEYPEVVGPPDTVFELEITWNRPDCLSVIGIAREVAAITGARLVLPPVSFEETGDPVERLASVSVEDAAACPRYTARALTGVRVGPSPPWMRRRLEQCGVRPINNVVDATNYVLLECGHPLHAFDLDRLDGGAIVVRRGRPGEKLVTLDGAQRDVSGLLVIADARRPVALAGVMGGEGSEIRDGTTRVLLESACFHPPEVHAASVSLALSTESSHRFERGVDIGGVDRASRRAAALIAGLAGAAAARGAVDLFPRPPVERRVKCRFGRARALLGMEIGDGQIVSILERLGMETRAQDAASCTVAAPTFRGDVEIEADLIEEVARIHGLDGVPDAPPVSRVVPGLEDDERATALTALREALVGLGLREVINYSMVAPQLLADAPWGDPALRVVLPNPVSADQSVLRPSLAPQMLATLGANLARQTADLRLFEIGRVFGKTEAGGTAEETRVAIGLTGKAGRCGTDTRRPVKPEEAFLWLKGIVEALCSGGRLDGPARFVPARHPCMEEGQALSLFAGDVEIGLLGLVRADIRRTWRMAEPVALAELSAAPWLRAGRAGPALRPVPAYPAVVRDVALVVDEGVTHDSIVRAMRESAPEELTRIELFDIFRGEGIGAGRKSVAYSLVYRSMCRTLTDEDANRYHEAVKDAVKRKLNAQIREG